MKKAILKKITPKFSRKEREKNMIINGREMFIEKKPRVEIDLYRVRKTK